MKLPIIRTNIGTIHPEPDGWLPGCRAVAGRAGEAVAVLMMSTLNRELIGLNRKQCVLYFSP
jgi:hypothetical protein